MYILVDIDPERLDLSARIVERLIAHAGAELRVDITQGKAEPLPIAVTDFAGVEVQDVRYGQDIAKVIGGNVMRVLDEVWAR